jgi:hypothetical protein
MKNYKKTGLDNLNVIDVFLDIVINQIIRK